MNDDMVKDNLPVKMHYLVKLSKLKSTSKQNFKTQDSKVPVRQCWGAVINQATHSRKISVASTDWF